MQMYPFKSLPQNEVNLGTILKEDLEKSDNKIIYKNWKDRAPPQLAIGIFWTFYLKTFGWTYIANHLNQFYLIVSTK